MSGKILHPEWRSSPSDAETILADCTRWARQIENAEAERLGVPIVNARASAARKIGVSPGTLEGLRRGRVKSPSAWVYERIREAVSTLYEKQLSGLANDITIARGANGLPDDDPIRKAEATLMDALAQHRERS